MGTSSRAWWRRCSKTSLQTSPYRCVSARQARKAAVSGDASHLRVEAGASAREPIRRGCCLLRAHDAELLDQLLHQRPLSALDPVVPPHGVLGQGDDIVSIDRIREQSGESIEVEPAQRGALDERADVHIW